MASIIPGYEYDIFISYRQKDNKHDGWVTEFVDNLKGELESTFKEEVSVYFDINPHDGLLETHDVDASLKEKLKCLIFIPIISRTYCDPKSFAWEHEFKAFVEQASQDQFGLKVKLSNGNVANRVLPIRIHDLDNKDVKLFEGVIGGVIRTLDFVFKTASGVNRPLKAKEDHPNDNLNKTYYQDQINKVSLAIKEIIIALGQNEQKSEVVLKEIPKPVSIPRKSNKTKIIAWSTMALALVVFGFLFLPKLIKPSEQLDKPIAVLPFVNDSPDKDNLYFCNGMMDEILTQLQKIGDLRVKARTSVEKYRNPGKDIKDIGRELGVSLILEGSVRKVGDDLRITAQLIDTKTGDHLWADTYNGKYTAKIFEFQNDVAKKVAASLNAVITPEQKQLIERTPTSSLTAYDIYLKANDFLMKYEKARDLNSYQTAVNLYNAALSIDSTYAKAYSGLASSFYIRYQWETYFKEKYLDSMLILAKRALSIDDQLDEAYYLEGIYFEENGQLQEAQNAFDKAIKINPNYYSAYVAKGGTWFSTDFVGSIKNYQKALTLISGNERSSLLKALALIYHDIGFGDKAKLYYKQALELDGDSADYFLNLSSIEFSKENFENAILLSERANKIDSIKIPACELYNIVGQDQKAYISATKEIEKIKNSGTVPLYYFHRIGYALWKVGKIKEADYYFKEQIKYDTESIKLGREIASMKSAQYDLAAVYAFSGDKTKAYQYLDDFNTLKIYPLWWISYAKHDPLFASIRNEKRFQNILQNMETKYQAEHERVRKWLKEQGML